MDLIWFNRIFQDYSADIMLEHDVYPLKDVAGFHSPLNWWTEVWRIHVTTIGFDQWTINASACHNVHGTQWRKAVVNSHRVCMLLYPHILWAKSPRRVWLSIDFPFNPNHRSNSDSISDNSCQPITWNIHPHKSWFYESFMSLRHFVTSVQTFFRILFPYIYIYMHV